MISVVVFGRNDSHGYNLAKRAAISLNCIAHLLEDPEDEIIFVDCNTPNDIPTFPEAIADTLTERTKRFLRVLRIRPNQYDQYRNGCKFKLLEPLCRNVGIRRSNPKNRWILNTNTDMVFAPLIQNQSFSRMLADLPDGFYELPRFEIPETLWESVNRLDPEKIIADFLRWGYRFHLNEIVTSGQGILFDNPGDFQLCLRSQLFEIHGFNEKMVHGWHVDSNLCKRMWLLNGETSTVLNKLYAYHCDHTRVISSGHSASSATSNSFMEFYDKVVTPYVESQANSWGMADEYIEEISLTNSNVNRISIMLEKILPGMNGLRSDISLAGNCIDTGLYYDDHHVIPYIADVIIHGPPRADIVYVGSNMNLAAMIAEFRCEAGHTGNIVCDSDTLTTNMNGVPDSLKVADTMVSYHGSSMVIFDFSMKHLPWRYNSDGFRIPELCMQVESYVRLMHRKIIDLAHSECKAGAHGSFFKQFLFVGSQNSSFDIVVRSLFECALTPVSTYVRQGFVRTDALDVKLPLMPFHYYVIGNSIQDYAAWVAKAVGREVTKSEIVVLNNLCEQLVAAWGTPLAKVPLDLLLASDAGIARLKLEAIRAETDGQPILARELHAVITGK